MSSIVPADAAAPASPPISIGVAAAVDTKHSPEHVELFEFDRSPIGNRDPLLLVHGVRGELWADCFRWKAISDYLTADDDFNRRFKIYFARYNSYQPLDKTVADFKPALLGLSDALARKPITVLALSIGGNVVAESMADADVSARIQRVMTFGTPFHGSPLFSKSWMDYSMVRWHKTPVTVLDTCLPYEIYFAKHKNLVSDLNWDNSDKMIPAIGRYRMWFHPTQHPVLSPEGSANSDVFALNESKAIDKSKFITYAGYLETGAVRTKPPGALMRAAAEPWWFLSTVLWMHVGKEHPVLRSLNLQIAHAVLPNSRRADTNGFAYGLNDGITPVVSSLFLPNSAMANAAICTESDVQKLRSLVDVRRARVFKQVDHLSFVDGYRPHGAPQAVRDLLSNDEEAKPVFAWILNDIMNEQTGGQLAVGPKRK